MGPVTASTSKAFVAGCAVESRTIAISARGGEGSGAIGRFHAAGLITVKVSDWTEISDCPEG
jgi:hypothetical protein